jgi:Mg2+ and Co2+ transporter CorA
MHNKTRISQAIKMVTSLMAVHPNKLVAERCVALVNQNNLMVEQNNVVANQSGVLVEQNKLLLNQNQEAVKQSETVIRQNKLSKARNSSLAFLTGVTTVLLPFTTIATYMAIPVENGLGPRSKDQWIYWISSGLLATVLIFTFLIGYRWQKWNVDHEGEDNHRVFSWLLLQGRKKNDSQARSGVA